MSDFATFRILYSNLFWVLGTGVVLLKEKLQKPVISYTDYILLVQQEITEFKPLFLTCYFKLENSFLNFVYIMQFY